MMKVFLCCHQLNEHIHANKLNKTVRLFPLVTENSFLFLSVSDSITLKLMTDSGNDINRISGLGTDFDNMKDTILVAYLHDDHVNVVLLHDDHVNVLLC